MKKIILTLFVLSLTACGAIGPEAIKRAQDICKAANSELQYVTTRGEVLCVNGARFTKKAQVLYNVNNGIASVSPGEKL